MSDVFQKIAVRWLCCFALGVVLVAGCSSRDACCDELPSISRIEATTVRILFGGSSGSAVAIGESDGRMYYATAKHCTTKRVSVFVPSAGSLGRFNRFGSMVSREQDVYTGKVEFWSAGGRSGSASAKTEWRSGTGDCAIISTASWPDTLVVSRTSNQEIADSPVRIFSGYPHGHGLSVMVGREAGSRTFDAFDYSIVTTCPSPGHSGGPVMVGCRPLGVTCMQVPGLDICDNAFHPFGKDFFSELSRLGVEFDSD